MKQFKCQSTVADTTSKWQQMHLIIWSSSSKISKGKGKGFGWDGNGIVIDLKYIVINIT